MWLYKTTKTSSTTFVFVRFSKGALRAYNYIKIEIKIFSSAYEILK